MSRAKRNARHTDDKKKTEGPLDNMQTRYKLYLDRILNSWGDRSWEFAIGLYMIKLHGSSFTLTAVQGIFASLTVILFSPLIGRWIERESRLREIKVCLIVQNAATAISCIFLSLFFVREKFSNETLIKTIETSAPIVLIVFSAISQLYSYGYSLCLEKDWIIALARDEKELSDWNAMLRRIDLCCKTIAPSLIGFLMEYSTLVSVLFIMSWNVISGFLEYFVLKSVFNEKHQALLAPKPKVSSSLKIIDIDAFKQYYKHFLLPGLSFGLLYLTVLGFDSITIGYISSQGIPEGAIGMISVVGAVFGILGTILFQLLSKRLSIKRVGFVGYLLEVTLLSLCLLEVFKPFDSDVKIFGGDLNVFLFLSGLVGSRVGLWTADLSVNQLIQTRTPCPSLVGGVQNSVSISAELVKFGIVTVMPNFDQFPILIVLSFGAISLATILFGFYSFRKDTDSSEPLVDESSCYDMSHEIFNSSVDSWKSKLH